MGYIFPFGAQACTLYLELQHANVTFWVSTIFKLGVQQKRWDGNGTGDHQS